MANGDVVKTAARARKSAAGYVFSHFIPFLWLQAFVQLEHINIKSIFPYIHLIRISSRLFYFDRVQT